MPRWIQPSTRLAIYHRDGFSCAYCGDVAEDGCVLTLDHVLARDLGGSNDSTNLVTSCLSCNSSKQNKTMREWYRNLRDRGIDTSKVGARVRRQLKKAVDRKEGRRLACIRRK